MGMGESQGQAEDEPLENQQVQAFTRMSYNEKLLHIEKRHGAPGLVGMMSQAALDIRHDLEHRQQEFDHEHSAAPSAIPGKGVPAARFLPPVAAPHPTERQRRSAFATDIRFADVDRLGGERLWDADRPELWAEGDGMV